jgi:phosphatidylserine/phosphatidylglycerophosphate/cardiolipin synthase-like enzyme
MYDVTDTRGDERQKLKDLGVELKEAPSSNGRKVFTVCHQKFAVIDEAILLLGSANWATTSIPLITVPGKFKKGNREWIVRIDDTSLAKWFKGLFAADWDIPEMEMPPGIALEVELRPEATYFPSLLANIPDEVFDLKNIELQNPITVTPVISPVNYFDLVKRLISEAQTSVDIEQQYILCGGPKTQGLLAALEQRKDDLEIRIIVSPAFRKEGAKDNWELSMDSLDAFNLKDRLRAMNLSYYTHLHNKGVIIDRQKVIVSSTNWSENSIARAREAGVLIESPEIAEYYAKVFDFDWSIAWDTADVPANILQLFQEAIFVPGALEEVHPADLV